MRIQNFFGSIHFKNIIKRNGFEFLVHIALYMFELHAYILYMQHYRFVLKSSTSAVIIDSILIIIFSYIALKIRFHIFCFNRHILMPRTLNNLALHLTERERARELLPWLSDDNSSASASESWTFFLVVWLFEVRKLFKMRAFKLWIS